MIQAPLMGGIVDAARNSGESTNLQTQLHIIIGASTVGTILGILLLPTFVTLFSKLIVHFETAGSLPQLVKNVATIEHLQYAKRQLRFPTWQLISRLRIGGIPKRLLVLNMLITAIYTAGILATLYASVLAPEYQSTAAMSSGLINGIATIALTILIDPKVALLTEQVMAGKQGMADMDKTVGILMVSRLLGTVAAQAVLLPAAWIIVWFCKIVN